LLVTVVAQQRSELQHHTRVLVVDDDRDVRWITAEEFREISAPKVRLTAMPTTTVPLLHYALVEA